MYGRVFFFLNLHGSAVGSGEMQTLKGGFILFHNFTHVDWTDSFQKFMSFNLELKIFSKEFTIPVSLDVTQFDVTHIY